MGTNCVFFVAELFWFGYERDSMLCLSGDKDAEVIEAFNTTSRYLDDLLNIDNTNFVCMVSQIYPSELQLNDSVAPFLDIYCIISDVFFFQTL